MRAAALVLSLLWFGAQALYSDVQLNNNRYDGVVVAINPNIPEDPALLQEIQSLLTSSSNVLWKATRHRAYFGNVTIVVPKTWSAQNYDVAIRKTYDKADIQVSLENPTYGNMPYTVQYGQCGSPGRNIQLTADYITDPQYEDMFGPKDKTLVHEWAHLRWGIFDETATSGYEDYYYDENGIIQYTRSPTSVLGENYVVDFEKEEVSTCQYKQETNFLPLDGCIFIPFENQKDGVHSSLMSFQYHQDIFTFDHDNVSDPLNLHDKDAPNEQNLLCSQRSEWDVITSSPDFASNANPSNDAITDVTPKFQVVQQPDFKIVLAFDVSDSMNSKEQFSNMKGAANLFVKEFVPVNSAVGLVQFEIAASTLSSLVTLLTDQDRELVTSQFPFGTRSKTCVGCGLLEAVNVLEEGGDPAGGQIIILTDGEENVPPYVRDVRDEIIDKGVTVNALLYGETSNHDLEYLITSSGGEWYYVNASEPASMISAFKSLAETNGGNLNTKLYQLFEDKYAIPMHTKKEGEVIIDSTVGEDTTFSFVWSAHWIAPDITLTDPDGQVYGNADASIDIDHKTVLISIPGVAKNGLWKFAITSGDHFQHAVAVVTTRASATSGTLPINVQSSMTAVGDSSETPIVIYSKVSSGYEALLGAEVQATISHPDGTFTDLYLFDNGAAPDIRANDGVYSRYFSEYTSSGKFAVKVKVAGMGTESQNVPVTSKTRFSSAAVNYGYVKDDGSVVLNTNLPQPVPPLTTQDVDPFTRITTLGSFTHEKSISNMYNDMVPPSRIIDLKASQVDLLDAQQGIQITFTAPGDDNAIGRASMYDIRYVYDSTSRLLTSFNDGNPVTTDMLEEGDMENPMPAYVPQKMIIKFSDIPDNVDPVTIGIAMRAVDDAGNVADVSNVAVLNIFLSPPPISCTDENGNPDSSYPFEKNGDCLRFYQCAQGELKTMDCTPGAVFDPIYDVCSHPSLVPGCEDALN